MKSMTNEKNSVGEIGPKTKRTFGKRFGLAACLLGAALMSCTLEAGMEDDGSEAAQVEESLVTPVILLIVQQQKAKEESLLQKILPPDLIKTFALAKQINSVYSDVNGVLEAVKTVGRLLGILPENAVEQQMLQQLAAIRSDIADLHGTVLGVAHTENLRDILEITTEGVSAAQQARDYVAARNRAMPESTAQTVLFHSLNAANAFTTDALATDAAFFQRPFHGKNGVDDQNLGNTSGEWKEVIATPDIRSGAVNVWDWRVALPALVQTVSSRVSVLAAVYPDFIKTGRFRDELLRYRNALGTVKNKIASNIGCNFSIYQHAFVDSAPDYVFDLRAICVDPFTGIAHVVSHTAVAPGIPANCAIHWPGGAGRVCVCTSCAVLRKRVSQNGMPASERTALLDVMKRVPGFAAILEHGIADAKAALIRKIGLFEVQGLMDRLQTMATNHPGPLFPERLLPRKDVHNSCVQADAQSKLVLADCFKFVLILVPTPGGTVQVTHRDPLAQPWRYDPINGRFVYSDGRCMDVEGGNPRARARAQLWSCNGTDAQKWSYDPVSKMIRNALGNVLDVQWDNTAPGTPIWTWPESGGRAQRWGQ